MRRHATRDRDISLRRLSLANRWLLAASLTLTGVLTEVVAHASPGSAHASSTAARSGRHGHDKRTAKRGSASAGALKPPAQAPESSEPSSAPSSEAPVEPSPQATGESAPAEEAAPEPAQEAAPEAEASTPVVSGGS